MRRDDLRPDDELRAMLRRFDSPERVSADQRDALLSRIGADADLLLAARRPGPPAWWEFTAGWARTLIPLGVATAMVAAGVLLWTAHGAPPRELPRVASQDSLVSAVPGPVTGPRSACSTYWCLRR